MHPARFTSCEPPNLLHPQLVQHALVTGARWAGEGKQNGFRACIFTVLCDLGRIACLLRSSLSSSVSWEQASSRLEGIVSPMGLGEGIGLIGLRGLADNGDMFSIPSISV